MNYEASVFKLANMMYKTSSLPTSLLVSGQYMGCQFSCIWDSFQYKILCNYWMILSRVRVRVNSRRWFRGPLQQLQGGIAWVRVMVEVVVPGVATIVGVVGNATGAMSWATLHPGAQPRPK